MIYQTVQFLRNLIAPPFCAACYVLLDQNRVLCKSCIMMIQPLVSRTLSITEQKKCVVHAIGAYDQPLVKLILAKSNRNRTVAHQLGILLWQMGIVASLPFDYIVPIPLHWTRYAWRGYNQAQEIGAVIAHKSKKPMIHLLKRIRRTPYQSYFKRDDRIKNVTNVFARTITNVHEYRHKRILLIDDVMTTGATLHEAARVLWKLNPASISAVVVARTK